MIAEPEPEPEPVDCAEDARDDLPQTLPDPPSQNSTTAEIILSS